MKYLKNMLILIKKGRSDMVYITITIKDDKMNATIDFKNVAQYENFVCPAWLKKANNGS